MTAKQYLSQAYRLNERINSDLSELDRLRDLATSLSGVNYDGVRVSKTRSTEAPFEKTICKIIDAERKINAEIDRLVDLKAEISEAISQLANVDEQLLLRLPPSRTWLTTSKKVVPPTFFTQIPRVSTSAGLSSMLVSISPDAVSG